jgi:hypothetical protein
MAIAGFALGISLSCSVLTLRLGPPGGTLVVFLIFLLIQGFGLYSRTGIAAAFDAFIQRAPIILLLGCALSAIALVCLHQLITRSSEVYRIRPQDSPRVVRWSGHHEN